MKNFKIVIYSDKKYEYQAINFLNSMKYADIENITVVYYTVGFISDLNHENLIKVPFPLDPKLPNLVLYTPKICLHALDMFNGNFCYCDTDIIFSKRFKNFNLIFDKNFPMYCKSPLEYTFTWYSKSDGEIVYKSERKLMDYFNVPERTMHYVLGCFFTFNQNSKDFMEEWLSICENSYLLKDVEHNYPFNDETAVNVLLWKRNITENYGHKFVNTNKYETFNIVENDDNILHMKIDDNIWEYCENSSEIYFYHGYKGNNVVEDFKLF